MAVPDGPFGHVPDGDLRPMDVALAWAAMAEFEEAAGPVLGRLHSLSGAREARRAAACRAVAEEVERLADRTWRESFAMAPNWTPGDFADRVREIAEHAATGQSFHFGDSAVKELIVAHALDLVVQHFRISMVGGRRDSHRMAHDCGHIRAASDRRAERDRAILGGARPFSAPGAQEVRAAERRPRR